MEDYTSDTLKVALDLGQGSLVCTVGASCWMALQQRMCAFSSSKIMTERKCGVSTFTDTRHLPGKQWQGNVCNSFLLNTACGWLRHQQQHPAPHSSDNCLLSSPRQPHTGFPVNKINKLDTHWNRWLTPFTVFELAPGYCFKQPRPVSCVFLIIRINNVTPYNLPRA